MIQTLINMKNFLLQKMRFNANNLLIFAKATPIVYVTKSGVAPVCTNKHSEFQWRRRIMGELHDTGKEYKVKFDILSMKFLKDIARYGSKLLHISSDIYNSHELCIEGRNGICKSYPMQHIE